MTTPSLQVGESRLTNDTPEFTSPMHSLNRTLVLGTTLLTTAVFVTAGVVLYALVQMSLVAELDRSLIDRAGLLASTIEVEDGKLDLELIDLDMQTFEGRHPAAYVQLWSADGTTLYKSPSLAQTDLENRRPAPDGAEHFSAQLPGGRAARVVCLAFTPRLENAGPAEDRPQGFDEAAALARVPKVDAVCLALAQSTAQIDQTLARLRLFLPLVGGFAVAIASVAIWYYVARSLQPLKDLALQIGGLGEADLNEPIGGTSHPSEIGPLVDRLNELLRRLDAALQRERAMNANVAHELRNPLAGLRLKLDVAVARSRQPHEYQQTMDECRQIAANMEQMVDNLLSLARLDAGQIQLHAESVQLDELIRSQWESMADLANRRRLRVQWSLAPELATVTDAALLGVAVRNLLENAATYSGEDGAVSIRTSSVATGTEIMVANSGSQLSQADAENALVPFWRHDPSRNAAGIHCGLGLSLVQRIVAVLRGQLSVKSSPGGEFQIAIVLPHGTDGDE